jgi:acid phosphatase
LLIAGHDTGVTFGANWTRTFVNDVLGNSKFNNNTCVLITFDENEIYPLENRVYSLLLGDAIPKDLRGTNDSTFYTHYSQLSTIQVRQVQTTLTPGKLGIAQSRQT